MVRILDFDDSQSSANPPGAGTTGFFAEYGEFTFDAASGTSIDVTTLFSAKSPGGAESTEGVITSAPQNVVQIAEKTTGGEIEDGQGDKVFARITEAAGTWTLSFFTNEAGTETAHSLASQDIKFLYREVFTLENKPTIGASVLTYDSQNVLGDIPDAGAGQRGVVNTSAQTMDGVKEFSSRPTSGGVELGRKVEVEDEGGSVETDLKKINFIGAGVTAAQNGSGNVDVTIPGGGGGGSAVEIEDEGVSLTTDVTKINFVGAGVTASEPVADEVTVTIPGGGGGSIVVEDEGSVVDAITTTIDFVGAGVTATQESAGNVTVTVPGGGGGSNVEIENEGTSLTTAVTKINFKGTDITVSEPVADEIDVQVGDAFAGNPEDFNLYSAVIVNGGAAAVTSQSQTFIQSVNRPSLGVVDITWVPSFFSVAPAVNATANEDAANGDEGAFVYNVTTSGCTVKFTADSSLFDTDFSIEAIRQAADYDDKGPDDNFYGAIVANNGTASVTSESKSFIASATQNGTGTVDIVFNTSFFSVAPELRGSILQDSVNGDEGVFIQSITAAGCTVRTTADSLAVDAPFSLFATRQAGDYAGTPSGNENFFGARIQNNGTSSITTESQTFIQSVNHTATGTTDVTFTPGKFTVVPSLTGSIQEAAANGDEGVFIYAITTSGCTVRTTADSGDLDLDFTLSAGRQGGDYNSPGLPRKGFLGVLSSDPVSPSNGESWINSADKKHKFRTGGVTYSSAAYT